MQGKSVVGLMRNANGKLIRGPWGREDTEEIEEEPDLEGDLEQLLATMRVGDAEFEIVETEGGMRMGVLLRLGEDDFERLSMYEQGGVEFGVSIGGELAVDDLGIVALPIVEVQLLPLPEQVFRAFVRIADLTARGAADDLVDCLEAATLDIVNYRQLKQAACSWPTPSASARYLGKRDAIR